MDLRHMDTFFSRQIKTLLDRQQIYTSRNLENINAGEMNKNYRDV